MTIASAFIEAYTGMVEVGLKQDDAAAKKAVAVREAQTLAAMRATLAQQKARETAAPVPPPNTDIGGADLSQLPPLPGVDGGGGPADLLAGMAGTDGATPGPKPATIFGTSARPQAAMTAADLRELGESALIAGNLKTADMFFESSRKAEKTASEIDTEHLNQVAAKADIWGGIAKSIHSQETFTNGLLVAQMNGVDPELLAQIYKVTGGVYNEEAAQLLDQFAISTASVKAQTDMQIAAARLANDNTRTASLLESRDGAQQKRDHDMVISREKLTLATRTSGATVADPQAAHRKEFDKQPEVRRYRVVAPIVRSLRADLHSNTAAADLNFINGPAKVLDPDSVVLAAEAANIKLSGTPAERMEGLLSYIRGGGRIPTSMRVNLLNMVEGRVQPMEERFQELDREYNSGRPKIGGDKPLGASGTREGREQKQKQNAMSETPAYKYFTKVKGLSHLGALAMAQNVQQESGGDHRVGLAGGPKGGDGGKAKGVAQWHPDRWQRFEKWAADTGRSTDSREAQFDYILEEVDSSNTSRDALYGNDPEAIRKHIKAFERYGVEGDRFKGLDEAAKDAGAGKSAPKATQAQLEYTARKHNISVDEVKRRLGIK